MRVIPKDRSKKKLVEIKANQFQNLGKNIAFKIKGISGCIPYTYHMLTFWQLDT